VQAHRGLLEAHRADQRRVGRGTPLAGRRRLFRLDLRLDARRRHRWSAAALEAGGAGRVERVPQGVVERAQADLVARLHGPAGAHEVRPRAPLLGGDDRAQDTLDRRIQPLHERVMFVEPGAVDLHDDLRPRRFQRRPLELLDLLADHFAVEVPGARLALVASERGLVRGSPGADHQPAKAGRPRRAQRDRLGGPPDDHAGAGSVTSCGGSSGSSSHSSRIGSSSTGRSCTS
jgi:hypothetical protein